MGPLLSCCCPEFKLAMTTVENMSGTMDGVKLITDDTQLVVKAVKDFVGSIKSKTENLEGILCDDVKKTIDQIRGILDQVPKLPEIPQVPDPGMVGGFDIIDYIPGMSSPKPQAPAAQVHPEVSSSPAVSSSIAYNAHVEGAEPSFRY